MYVSLTALTDGFIMVKLGHGKMPDGGQSNIILGQL